MFSSPYREFIYYSSARGFSDFLPYRFDHFRWCALYGYRLGKPLGRFRLIFTDRGKPAKVVTTPRLRFRIGRRLKGFAEELIRGLRIFLLHCDMRKSGEGASVIGG
jgi:hypothetical protein